MLPTLLSFEPSPLARQFWLTIALTGIPGVLGGLTNGVSIYLKAIYEEKDKWPPSGHLSAGAFFSSQGVTGFGGAIAALLVALWAKRFPDENAIGMLELAATGFVAGYIGNRLLPAIADTLYDKYLQLAKKADETARKTEETHVKLQAATEEITRQEGKTDVALETANKAILAAEKKTLRAISLSTEMFRADSYLRGKDFVPVQTANIIGTLRSLAADFPLNRTLNILLSRTYNEAAGERVKAIEVLRDFIQAKAAANQGQDLDAAAAYWNIANYCEFQFRDTADRTWRTQALEAAGEALSRDSQTYYVAGGSTTSGEIQASSGYGSC
jgi:hypothetical protein